MADKLAKNQPTKELRCQDELVTVSFPVNDCHGERKIAKLWDSIREIPSL
jgi:hypothetical protein